MAGLGFARSQLEKHGWAEGKGLGKEEHGIKKAIKVGIKNDTQGVGYKVSDQFTFHWWDHIFNKTAKSIVVKENEDGDVHVVKDGTSNQPISSKRPNKLSQKPLLYGRFVKASSTTTSADVKSGTDNTDDEAEKDFSSQHAEDIVFKACGGRTAHKGARHGLKLNGKLKRIEEQERMALSAPCSRSASPDITTEHDTEQNTAELFDQLKSKEKKRKSKDDLKSYRIYNDSEGYVKKKKKGKKSREEKTEVENEVSAKEKSKKSERNSFEEEMTTNREEVQSCANRDQTKKKKKDKKRKDERKSQEKKKSSNSSDEDCIEISLVVSNEKMRDNYKTDKNVSNNLQTEEKSSLTEDKERRKAKKRKAQDFQNEIFISKKDKKKILQQNEESFTKKKKKKQKNK